MTENKLKRKILSAVAILSLTFSLVYTNLGSVKAEENLKGSARVNVAGAYLRKSPTTNSTALKLVYNGNSLSFSEEKFTSDKSDNSDTVWLYIPAYRGYIRSDLVSITYNVYDGRTAYGMNVRALPTTGSSIIGSFRQGTSVKIVSQVKNTKDESWYKIKYGNKYGYLSAKYVNLTSTSSVGITKPQTSTASQPSTSTSATTGSSSSDRPKGAISKGYATDYLNVRSGAGTNYSRVATIKANTQLFVFGTSKDKGGNTWYKVLYNGSYRYVAASFFRITENYSSSTSSSSATSSANSGSSQSGSSSSSFQTGVIKGKTTAPLNMRTGPSTSYRLVGTLRSGYDVDIYGTSLDKNKTTWYKIKYGSSYYYVSGDYVKVESATQSGSSGSSGAASSSGSGTSSGGTTSGNQSGSTPTTTTKEIKVGTTTTYVNIRTGAGTSYRFIRTLSPNTAFEIIGSSRDSQGNTWYELLNNGSKCYIISNYVRVTSKTVEIPAGSNNQGSSQSGSQSGNTGGSSQPITVIGTLIAPVNIRTAPGLKGSIAMVYSTGTRITIIDTVRNVDGYDWHKFSVGGKYYYCAAQYVSTGGTSSGSGESTPSTPAVSPVASMSSEQFDSYLANQGFPESYRSRLVALHRSHPTWDFKAINTGLDWNNAFAMMTKNSGTNTIQNNFPDAYKKVAPDTYNFLSNTYIGKDGAIFVAASEEAVAYYMDPRNWLTDSGVFMFEDHSYHQSYQTLDLVKRILRPNSILLANAEHFVTYGRYYNISPAYLAAKAILESGNSTNTLDGHRFTFNGKTYSNRYNVFNIGAYDASYGGAINGLLYANGGSSGLGTAYGRPWDSVEKAIAGGAQFISRSFVANKQSSFYTEHFNVLNGINAVGTHVFGTAVFGPSSTGIQTYSNYNNFGILNQPLEFYIPIYSNMPETPAKRPFAVGSNNNYLRSLSLSYDGGTKNLIITDSNNISSVYKTEFTLNIPSNVSSVNISATSSDSGAIISGTGEKSVNNGANRLNIKCISPTGKVRDYFININRQ